MTVLQSEVSGFCKVKKASISVCQAIRPVTENTRISVFQLQQMSKCAVGCHLWMKRENSRKTTIYSGCGAGNGRNSGKIELCF